MKKICTGFSIVEVLVSLLLICIGVLGMVAMQGRSVQYTQDSVQRTQAAMLANEMLELMRSNRGAVYDASGEIKTNSSYFKLASSAYQEPSSGCVPIPANSSSEQQRNCWFKRVREALPGADNLASEVHICRAGETLGSCGDTENAVEIQLAWRVKNGECMDPNGSDQTICHYRVRAEL